MTFKKGQSGNPKGRKTKHEEVREYLGARNLCLQYVPAAVKALVRDMDNAKEGGARVSAASKVIAIAEPETAEAKVVAPGGVTVVVKFGKDDE